MHQTHLQTTAKLSKTLLAIGLSVVDFHGGLVGVIAQLVERLVRNKIGAFSLRRTPCHQQSLAVDNKELDLGSRVPQTHPARPRIFCGV